MARLKKEHFWTQNKAGFPIDFSVQINVATNGSFYAKPPDYIAEIIDTDFNGNVHAITLLKLKEKLQAALESHAEPEVTKEHVIRYYVETQIFYAVDKHGNICPNASWTDNAEWHEGADTRLVKTHAGRPSSGGYMLKIGAEAMTKITHSYGARKKVTYSSYSKGAANLDDTANPAAMLNAWCAIRMPDDAKEMPYSDEAAMFFYDLMMGMARLCHMIDTEMGDPEKIQELIEGPGALRLGLDL